MTTDPEENGDEDIVDFIDRLLQKHRADVGNVAVAWNSLQNNLSKLFAVIATPDSHSIGYAAWNAVRSDRYQRDMLAETAKAVHAEAPALKELQWVLGQLDNLESKRNATIHAPYNIILNNGVISVIPDNLTNNRLAQQLIGKDMAKECANLSKTLNLLSIHCQRLMPHLRRDHWASVGRPLPERPQLPRDEEREARKKIQQYHLQEKRQRKQKPSQK